MYLLRFIKRKQYFELSKTDQCESVLLYVWLVLFTGLV